MYIILPLKCSGKSRYYIIMTLLFWALNMVYPSGKLHCINLECYYCKIPMQSAKTRGSGTFDAQHLYHWLYSGAVFSVLSNCEQNRHLCLYSQLIMGKQRY